ncbi:MAG: glycosyltransferase [Janthinobacterium lividum]
MKSENTKHVLLVGLQRFTKPVGLCRYTANLFNRLRTVPALHVTLVLGAWQKNYYRDILQVDVEDPNIIWVDLRKPSISRYGWCLWSLPKLARKLRVDVVHLLHQLPVLKALFHCPVILTMHDLYAYDNPEAIGYPNVYLNRLVIQSSLRASAEVVSISHVTKDRLCHWFPKLQRRMALPVIYQSVAVAEPDAGAAPIEGKFILCVAQHRKHKNLDLAIESYFLGISQGALDPTTRLLIVGSEGPETPHLKSVAGRVPGVQFLESIPDEYLAYLYKGCEVFLCASSTEGFCLPLVEAMLFSCRVVCADIPILNEVAGERATYFTLEGHSPQVVLDAVLLSLSSDRHTVGSSRLLSQHPEEEWTALYDRVAGAREQATA